MAGRDYATVQDQTVQATARKWQDLPFSEAVQINPTVSLDRGTVYPFVAMASVNAGTRHAFSAERREFKSGGSRFQTGDTLMARITPCLENGKIARYCAPKSSIAAHGSTEFIVIRGRPNVTDNEFAYYLTQSADVRNYAIGQMTGTSGRQRVPTDSLDHLIVSLPPLPEQRAIAHILGTLDDKIELNRRMNQTLEEMARALFKSWFVDFDPVRAKAALRQHALGNHAGPDTQSCGDGAAPGAWTVERARAYLDAMDLRIVDLFPDRLVDSELGNIPEGWEVKTLGESVELAYGKALRAADRKDGIVRVYGSNGQVGWHDERLVAGPGIVVGRKGSPGLITWAHGDFFPIDTTFYVVPRDANLGLPFLFFALTGQDLPSVAADSAVPGLNRNLAYTNRQLLSDNHILAEFNDYASSIFFRHDRLEEESGAIAAQRDVLLLGLVSGDLRT